MTYQEFIQDVKNWLTSSGSLLYIKEYFNNGQVWLNYKEPSQYINARAIRYF